MDTRSAPARHVFTLLAAGIAAIWLLSGPGPRVGGAQYAVPEVDLEQAMVLIGAGAVVIDVRGEEQFAHRHIPGALMVPLTALRQGIPTALEGARAEKIVIYCNQGRAHGPEATQILQQAGYGGAVNLKDGIEGWAAAGNPVATGG
ncbi:MAG: rhodanese-like domain-containing protein [Ectothiorhodospiraceae bacterium]|nr:rhodanese-like domain-containing protein [Chromatiales bacterium]MCP5154086.1 rhodanese-like domain-containing protein [Ectothiorhodospiraceae bacterium]